MWTRALTPSLAARLDMRYDLASLVAQYVDTFRDYLDAWRLAVRSHSVEAQMIHDGWCGRERDTAVRGRNKC